MKLRITILTVLLVLALVTMPAMAAEDDDHSKNSTNGIEFNDFFNKEGAEDVMDDSAITTPLDKTTGWGTFAIYGILAYYFGVCLLKVFSGDPEKRSAGLLGFGIGVLAIIAFMVCSTTAFDALTWEY